MRLLRSCTTGAEKDFGLADVPVESAVADLCVRALDAEELLVEVWPESSGVAEATAALTPEAISKPAPAANTNVVIRPARFKEVMLGSRVLRHELTFSALAISAYRRSSALGLMLERAFRGSAS
ncbi:hypothetical protein [Mycolicibacterium sphagni]|uniref:hypothetical protein n=1 Tax=Mycolicibacterium sphagni TaxID=1786 RepID=UPI001F34EC2A|nr:hypothetical protein [Mycolicibacterium sphagni]